LTKNKKCNCRNQKHAPENVWDGEIKKFAYFSKSPTKLEFSVILKNSTNEINKTKKTINKKKNLNPNSRCLIGVFAFM